MKRCLHCAHAYSTAGWRCEACGAAPAAIEGFPSLAPSLALGGAGFKAEAFPQLALLEAGNFWFVARNQLIVWALRRYLAPIGRYMEVGCGTGYVLAGVQRAFPAARLTGSEIFCEGLPFAAARVAGAELIQMDAREIPYVEEFDVIGAFDVLEHIQDDEKVLTEMFRAVRPGGGVILTVPQHPWLWSSKDDYACHVRRYRRGELRAKAERAGFRTEFESSFVSLLLPAMMAARLRRPEPNVALDPMAELRLPPFLNRIFLAVMRLELWLIRVGLRFALGGSLLLVAKKSEAHQ